MKPTLNQQGLIAQILRSILKYKDTYDEVYDHILSSLENVPEDVPFIDALHNVIENDLGGGTGIRAAERKRFWMLTHEFMNDYFRWTIKCLCSFPSLLICIGMTIACLLIKPLFNGVRPGSNLYSIAAPLLPLLVRKLTLMKRTRLYIQPSVGYAKSYIQSMAAMLMAFYPFLLYQFCLMLYYHIAHELEFSTTISATLIFIGSLHMLTYYRLFTDEKQIGHVTKPTPYHKN